MASPNPTLRITDDGTNLDGCQINTWIPDVTFLNVMWTGLLSQCPFRAHGRGRLPHEANQQPSHSYPVDEYLLGSLAPRPDRRVALLYFERSNGRSEYALVSRAWLAGEDGRNLGYVA